MAVGCLCPPPLFLLLPILAVLLTRLLLLLVLQQHPLDPLSDGLEKLLASGDVDDVEVVREAEVVVSLGFDMVGFQDGFHDDGIVSENVELAAGQIRRREAGEVGGGRKNGEEYRR